MTTLPLEDQITALEEGRAYVERVDLTTTVVSGADARSWLHDLVTADVDSLGRFQTRPSLLLTPTGRIRATFILFGLGGPDVLLVQPADQPAQVSDLLSPYVLSSDVALEPSPLRVVSLPAARAAPSWVAEAWRPGVLGNGLDLLIGSLKDDLADARRHLVEEGLTAAAPGALEALRIRRGIPRFPVDLDEDSLPAEADLEPAFDFTKGCFLGQESVAKVRNLGHPPRLALALRAEAPVSAGEAVLAGDEPVGVVTSATPIAEGTALLARVRWAARGSDLVAASGSALAPV